VLLQDGVVSQSQLLKFDKILFITHSIFRGAEYRWAVEYVTGIVCALRRRTKVLGIPKNRGINNQRANT
jgi:hypothetical protein